MSTTDHLQRAKEAERQAEDLKDRQKNYQEAARLASIAAQEYGAAGESAKQQELSARSDYYMALHYYMSPKLAQLDIALTYIEKARKQFEKLQIDLWIRKSEHISHRVNAQRWLEFNKFDAAKNAIKEAMAISQEISKSYPAEVDQPEWDVHELSMLISEAEAVDAREKCEFDRAINKYGEAIADCAELCKLAKSEDEKLQMNVVKGYYEITRSIINGEHLLEGWDTKNAKLHFNQALKKISEIETDRLGKISPSFRATPEVQLIDNAIKAYKPWSEAMVHVCDAQEALMKGRSKDVVKSLKMAHGEFQNAQGVMEVSGTHAFISKLVNRKIAVIHDRLKTYSANRFSWKGLTVDAGKQFFIAFLLTFFLLLYISQFIQVGGELILKTSLLVAAITAFGLNALRFKEMLGRAQEQKIP